MIVVDHISDALGVEVAGLDLGQPSGGDIDALRALLDEHIVVAVRDQHLDPDAQLRLTSQLGGIWIHPVDRFSNGPITPVARHGARYDRPNGAGGWHFDFSSVQRPPLYGILQSVGAPSYGGDTRFTNLKRAYLTLPDELRRVARCISADHAVTDGAAQREQGGPLMQPVFDRLCAAVHPVVTAHPHTGEAVLYVCDRLTSGTENADVMQSLIDHVTDEQLTARWRWTTGDVVIYDQRACSHAVAGEPWPGVRTMQRTLVTGPSVEAYQSSSAI